MKVHSGHLLTVVTNETLSSYFWISSW